MEGQSDKIDPSKCKLKIFLFNYIARDTINVIVDRLLLILYFAKNIDMIKNSCVK